MSLDQMKKTEHHLEILDLHLGIVARYEFVVFLSQGGGEFTYINCICRKRGCGCKLDCQIDGLWQIHTHTHFGQSSLHFRDSKFSQKLSVGKYSQGIKRILLEVSEDRCCHFQDIKSLN